MRGPERISIELTRQCAKACWFCYNGSGPARAEHWTTDEAIAFVADCADHGVRAVSFGGGEPLEHPGLLDVLRALAGRIFRSVTTNGLLLDAKLDALVDAAPDKVHVSIHFPGSAPEVARVVRQAGNLAAAGLRSGVNLLVARSQTDAARRAWGALREAGIGSERIVLLPQRGFDTPSPAELAGVAAGERFQSVSCLLACGPSPRFVSLSADKRVAWCSYTVARAPLPSLDHRGLRQAVDGLGLVFCGGQDGRPARLPRGAQHGHDLVRGGP